ncbi:MAG TPA: carnitine dehydratase, partial [Deltaproteobacteria bacterium]|nr:carnitine dehydratase [Deltaproteobacteria bacterium]
PGRPDLVREMRQRAGSVSAAHATVNRSKRCISLDLKVPDSLQLVDQLLESHDILLEQFRPGVMQRLGLGYEQLQVEHPKLIYCSLTGYGQTGPY